MRKKAVRVLKLGLASAGILAGLIILDRVHHKKNAELLIAEFLDAQAVTNITVTTDKNITATVRKEAQGLSITYSDGEVILWTRPEDYLQEVEPRLNNAQLYVRSRATLLNESMHIEILDLNQRQWIKTLRFNPDWYRAALLSREHLNPARTQ